MLHNDASTFEQIILRVAENTGIEPSIIEKDYYVTLFLQRIIALQPNIIFKGGTSLSKCYKLINRFSEDIDLNIETDLSEKDCCFLWAMILLKDCGIITIPAVGMPGASATIRFDLSTQDVINMDLNALYEKIDDSFEKFFGVRTHISADNNLFCAGEFDVCASDLFGDLFVNVGRIDSANIVCFKNFCHFDKLQ